MASRRHPTRALELLKRLVASAWFDRETLAQELVIPVGALDAYLDESAAIPLDRQLCLALFVIDRVPPLSRLGQRLRGQVKAAIAFNEHATLVHTSPPPSARLR